MTANFSDFRTAFFDSLGEASQWLRLFDFVPNVYLYVKDIDGRFVAMNEALVRMRGAKSQDELIGKTDVDLHPIYWGNLYREEDLRVIQSDQEVRDQVWLVPVESGELRSFVSSKIPLRDRKGRCIGIAGVMYPLESELEKAGSVGPVGRAVAVITDRFHQPLQIQDLATEVGLSISQLNRRFRATYQMTPSEYLQRIRVHQACRMLAEGESSIGDVAHETGFFDQAHFTRTFRKWRRMTPSEFRRETRTRNQR